MQQQLNRYTCEDCKQSIVTIDRDKGTTPMMLRCRATRGCKGMMMSAWYTDVKGEPAFEWRKPTKKEYRRASAPMKEHFDMGGLDIYPIKRKQS